MRARGGWAGGLLLGMACAVSAQSPHRDPDALYDEAVDALNLGDCYTAARSLRAYKVALGARLDAEPAFKRVVDQQIRICDGIAAQVKRSRKIEYIRAPAPPPP